LQNVIFTNRKIWRSG